MVSIKNYACLPSSGKWRFVIALSCCFFLGGLNCGYTVNHRLRDAFQNPKGIFVPVLDNASDETGAERVFTNALIRELQSRGEIVFRSREQGGLELSGNIAAIDIAQTASTEKNFGGLAFFRSVPTEVGISVTLALRLSDSKTGKMLWSNTFQGYRTLATPIDRTYSYQAPSSLGASTQSLIELTYSDIARDMMRDVYDDMVELF